MNKKDYKKPTTKVVKLEQQSHILQSSPAEKVGVQNYGWNNIEEE